MKKGEEGYVYMDVKGRIKLDMCPYVDKDGQRRRNTASKRGPGFVYVCLDCGREVRYHSNLKYEDIYCFNCHRETTYIKKTWIQ